MGKSRWQEHLEWCEDNDAFLKHPDLLGSARVAVAADEWRAGIAKLPIDIRAESAREMLVMVLDAILRGEGPR